LSSLNLVYAFINPLSSLCAEIEGRHYGGGVLELVPSEIEELLIPILPDKSFSKSDLKKLSKLIQSEKMEKVLKDQSNRVLDKVGITKKEQNILLEGWTSLRLRRQRVSN
jgi:nitrate reductase beta subunit